MHNVLASAAKAKIGALFLNGQEALPIRVTLTELGHMQPATPMQTDNSTAASCANDTIKQKRSKAIDMRFYWIRDRTRQGQFVVYWRKGILNKADYFTKHHSGAYHQRMCSQYLAHCAAQTTLPQDCKGVLNSTTTLLENTESSPSSQTGTAGDVRQPATTVF